MLFFSASIQSICTLLRKVIAFGLFCVLPAIILNWGHWLYIGTHILSYSFWLNSFYYLVPVFALLLCFAHYLRAGLLPKAAIKCKELFLARAAGLILQVALSIMLLTALFCIVRVFFFDLSSVIANDLIDVQGNLIHKVLIGYRHLWMPHTWHLVWDERHHDFGGVFFFTLIPILLVPVLAILIYKPLTFLFARIEPYYAKALQKRIAKTRSGDKGLSDIDQEHQAMMKLASSYRDLNESYIKLDQGLFVGFDEKGKGIYVNWERFCETHMSIIGATGNGKGAVTGCLLYQCILRDHSICCFDFKAGADKFMPKVLQKGVDLYNSAHKANKRLHLIDLNSKLPLLNLIDGISEGQFRELLESGFNLYYQGKDSDYYRKHDVGVLKQVAKMLDKANSLPQLWSYILKNCPEILLSRKRDLDKETRERLSEGGLSLVEMRESFCLFAEQLEALALLPVLDTDTGINLKKAILNGDALYFIGSRNDTDIKILQKMLTLRITQIIEDTNAQRTRQVTCFFDEVKYILSRALTQAVGIIRDKHANCLFNYQDIENLSDVSQSDPSLSGKSVKSEILGNCALKIVYGVGDVDTRQWASNMTGKSVITTTSHTSDTNALAYTIDDGEQYATREVWQNKYTVNTFAQLPKRVGVLMGDGVAKLVFTAFINVDGIDSPVTRLPAGLIEDANAKESTPADSVEAAQQPDTGKQAAATQESSTDHYSVDDSPASFAEDDLSQFDIEDLTFEDEEDYKGGFGRGD